MPERTIENIARAFLHHRAHSRAAKFGFFYNLNAGFCCERTA
jgi:hypothetical protein